MTSFVVYLRVSTARQGESGLGLEAQEESVRRFLNGTEPLAIYTEILSGKRDDRPELAKALDHCRRSGATLLCAKLDRLGRRAAHVLGLLDKADVPIRFADAPHASALELGMRAIFAQEEGDRISQRTREALAAAKRRGVKLGSPNGAAPLQKYIAENGNGKAVRGNQEGASRRAAPWRTVFEDLATRGLSLRAMARELNERGERTAKGCAWQPMTVSRMIRRLSIAKGERLDLVTG